MFEVLVQASLVLMMLASTVVAMLSARRHIAAVREARLHTAERRLRRLALRIIDGDADLDSCSTPHDRRVVASMLTRLAPQLRGHAHQTIAQQLCRSGAIDEQARLLGARRSWRRATAARMLGDMGAIEAVPILISALRDSAPEVRSAAAWSLGALREPAGVGPVISAFVQRRLARNTAGQTLLDIGPASLPHLHQLARGPNADDRSLALELVGQLGTAADARQVTHALGDSSSLVRASAASALGRLGGPSSIDDLLVALDDHSPRVRAASARSLGDIGDPVARPRLLQIARMDAYEPAQAAGRAAAALDPHLGAEPSDGHLRDAIDCLYPTRRRS